MNSPSKKHIIVLNRKSLTPTAIVMILTLVVVFSSYSFSRRENQLGNAQGLSTTRLAGGEVNVLYAGPLIPIMETKIGPAFSHSRYQYDNRWTNFQMFS